jgi:prepilin peptidase CpaA
MVQWSLITVLTALAFVIDIRHSIIPNWLTITAVSLGLTYHVYRDGVEGLVFSTSGFLIGLVLLFILHLFGAIGAGDVKLFAAYGAVAGMEFVMQSIIYTLIYACLIGIVILISQKKLFQRIIWVVDSLFSLLILKQWVVFKLLQPKQMLRFPLMWAVLPAIITYGISLKGLS